MDANEMLMQQFEQRIDDIIANKAKAPLEINPYKEPEIPKEPSQDLIDVMGERVQQIYYNYPVRLAREMSDAEKKKVRSRLPKGHEGELVAYYDNKKVFERKWFIVTTTGYVDSAKNNVAFIANAGVERAYHNGISDLYTIHELKGGKTKYYFPVRYGDDMRLLLAGMGNKYDLLNDRAIRLKNEAKYNHAKACYLEAAINGNNMYAQVNIGQSCSSGGCFEKDLDAAVYWCERSAKQGYPNAMETLAWLYYNKRHYKEAYTWYSKLAEAPGATEEQKGRAYRWKAYMNAEALGSRANYALAKENFEKSVELKNTDVFQSYGYFHTYRMIDYEKAFEMYQNGARMGSAQSLNSLGLCYFLGWGVKRNFIKAKDNYDKAVEKGNKLALLNLGRLYFYECKDFAKGMEYFQRAIEENQTNAYGYIALSYKNGLWGAPDYEKFMGWLQKGVDAGSTYSTYLMAKAYQEGTGVEKDEVKAMELLISAAERGDSDAKVDIGVMLLNHAKTPQNEERAKNLLQLGRPEQSTYAKLQQAILSAEGIYETMDDKTIRETLRMVAILKDSGNSLLATKQIVKYIMEGKVFEFDRGLITEVRRLVRRLLFFEPTYSREYDSFEFFCRPYIIETSDSIVASYLKRVVPGKMLLTDVEANLNAATDALKDGLYSTALHCFEYAFENSEPSGTIAYNIAQLYLDNIRVTTTWEVMEKRKREHPDYEMAEQWTKRAIELECLPAKELLQKLYREAAYCYAGILKAAHRDCYSYFNEKNLHKSETSKEQLEKDWLQITEKLADWSISRQAYNMEVLRPIIDKAIYYHKQITGDKSGVIWLAHFYAVSGTSSWEFEMAVDYMKTIRDLDFADKSETLDGIYYMGNLLDNKYLEKKWKGGRESVLEMCASVGEPISMYLLAYLYQNEKKYREALKWYEEAKAHGCTQRKLKESIRVTSSDGKERAPYDSEVDIDKSIEDMRREVERLDAEPRSDYTIIMKR